MGEPRKRAGSNEEPWVGESESARQLAGSNEE